MYDCNWQTIRAWNGSQYNGFEELCVQLARLEVLEGAEFIATGNPDAGVECYCVLADKTSGAGRPSISLLRLQTLNGSNSTVPSRLHSTNVRAWYATTFVFHVTAQMLEIRTDRRKWTDRMTTSANGMAERKTEG